MDYMVIMDYAPSYQNEMRAKMKSVLNWVKREMGIEVPNDIRKVYVVNDHIEIPLKYYPMLLNHTIAPSDDLEMVLDTMMKIQLSTALRFIDVYELKSENISWGETPMVSTRNKKTNVKTIAPLAKSASVLIKRNLDETGDVFRGYRKYINPLEGKTYKKQTFIFYLNNWIKHIATNFISESCEISKQNAAGEVYRDYVEISKEITSHDLRRLAANYYLNSGASEMAVKNMLGHAKDSRAFKKHYVQAYSRENVEEIIKIQSDL
jgi:integrase